MHNCYTLGSSAMKSIILYDYKNLHHNIKWEGIGETQGGGEEECKVEMEG